MKSLTAVIFFRLSLVVTLAFVLGFVLILSVGQKFFVAKMYEDSAFTAQVLSRNLEANYQHQLASLDNLFSQEKNKFSSNYELKNIFEGFLAFENIFTTLHYYDIKGNLLVAAKRDSVPNYRIEKNYHDRNDPSFGQFADRTIKSKAPAVSEVFYTSKGKPYQTYLVPMLKNNEVVGLISGGIFLAPEQLGYLLSGVSSSPKHIFALADSNGKLLLKSDTLTENILPEITPYLDYSANEINTKNIDSVSTNDYTGPSFYLVTEKIKSLGFTVTYGVSHDFIKDRQIEVLKLFVFGLSLSLMVAFGLTFMISRLLSHSLDDATEALREINIGNFSVQIPERKQDLFPTVTQQINHIAAKLKKDRTLGEIWSGDKELKEYLDNK